MKALAAVALLSLLGTAASAKLAPIEPQRITLAAADDDADFIGPAGAMMELDYFRTPRPSSIAIKVFPCRLWMSAKTRLAQTCH